jgi:2-(1,2-epoxy-1,2-dihydrophenyl)acetyl-CoA isomerase
MEYQYIRFEVSERVATITFNRPEVGNAFFLGEDGAQDTPAEVADAVSRCAGDDSIGALVLTGSGKHFCAGGDINRFKRLIESGKYLELPNIRRVGDMAQIIRRCPKPVIAMVNGAAAGAGCSVALACDFRVMSPKSKLVMAFINMGLSGDTGGLYYLHRVAGVSLATEMMMTGRAVSGEEAFRRGIATLLAEGEDSLAETTRGFAVKLSNSPLAAIARQKELINRFFYTDIEEYLPLEGQAMMECSHTDDFKEAVYAFLEKRPPVFTGK